MALGAFLSGLIVGRSDYSLRAASDALPMRDAFAVLFFVAVGMLLDPRVVVQAPALTAATLIVVLVGKPAAALLLMWLLRYPFRVSVAIAIALAQIGEFSFILSSLARDLGLFTAEATNTLVAVSIVSIVVNPLLYRAIPAMDDWVNRRPTLRRWLNPSVATDVVTAGAAAPQSLRQRAVIVGYGPTGRSVSRLLRENGIEPVVIEMNIDTVRRLRSEGQLAIYGDAAQPDTLIAAEIANAESLILTSAGMSNTAEAIRTAREINPKVPVFARAGYVRDIDELHHAGADEVFSGESEVALAFTEAILQRLGATAEQIDRERERAHAELFGPATRRSRDSVEAATPHQGS
jgi:CPA2 family monovalent cation:H+ antiporter-2